jgi:hypothetical protein
MQFLSEQRHSKATTSIVRGPGDLIASQGTDEIAIDQPAVSGETGTRALALFALAAPKSTPVAIAAVHIRAKMPTDLGRPALVALLRRRRDLKHKARPARKRALATHVDAARDDILWLAQ